MFTLLPVSRNYRDISKIYTAADCNFLSTDKSNIIWRGLYYISVCCAYNILVKEHSLFFCWFLHCNRLISYMIMIRGLFLHHIDYIKLMRYFQKCLLGFTGLFFSSNVGLTISKGPKINIDSDRKYSVNQEFVKTVWNKIFSFQLYQEWFTVSRSRFVEKTCCWNWSTIVKIRRTF